MVEKCRKAAQNSTSHLFHPVIYKFASLVINTFWPVFYSFSTFIYKL